MSDDAKPVTAPRWQAIDGLRGYAVVAVLLYHFGVLPGGYAGVDVFFVISGFVVTNALLRRSSGDGWLRTFYERRGARLIPNLLLTLAAAACWHLISGDFGRRQLLALASGALQVFNLAGIHGGIDPRGLGHLWSLSVEWQFYAVAPFLVVWLARARPRVATQFLVGAAVATVAARVFALETGVSKVIVYNFTLYRLGGMFLGVALALGRRASWGALRRPLAITGLVLLVALPLVAPRWWPHPAISLLIVMPLVEVATLLVTWGIVGQSLPVRSVQLLASRPMVWIGERSYSLYLWHYLIGVGIIAHGTEEWQGLGTFVWQLVASCTAAVVAYALVEQPARIALNRLIDRRRARSTGGVLDGPRTSAAAAGGMSGPG